MMAPLRELLTPLQAGTIAAFLVAIGGSLALTPFVVRGAAARGLYENPRGGERGPRRQVSRLGGIVIFATTVIGLLVAQQVGAIPATEEARRVMPGLMLGGTLIFLLGLYDDIRGVRARHKLIVQTLAALLVYGLGTRIGVITLGGAIGVDIGFLSLPLTLLWIVGVTNAFNLIDGMDGLATGIGLVVLSAVLLAAMMLGNLLVVVVSLVLVGSLLGFLRYNTSPARIFLGDSGSLFIGFMLAVLTIHGSLKSTTAVLVAIPVFALAVPLLDTSVAILRRLIRGSPVFGPDARHIHHRLQAIGLAPRKAAIVMWWLSGAFAVYGLSVAFAPPPLLLGLAILGGVLAASLMYVGVRQLEYVEIAEAALAVVRRGDGLRKKIRDQIHARETLEAIARVGTLDELNALLAERRFRFGFAQIEVNRQGDLREAPAAADLPRLMRLDYPLSRAGEQQEMVFWLRTWSPLDVKRPTHTATRVARILGPAIEQWLEESAVVRPESPAQRSDRRRGNEIEVPLDVSRTGEAPWPAL